ncbi:hypothetical protein LN042_14170 [Kitasatospora sp. RB6PN24]|uniref:hypothetical protein n=1 Tax=Kitasatospora humi TaxID=2893891 RepID=UPI001E288896|nr:hypothetical protein [Kitasatospora humi]MCC9308220.1 hypothetical protein [Kitasatospora humi]
MSDDGSSPEVRRLIADWLLEPPPVLPGVPALEVPQAPAAEVIAAARRLVAGCATADRPRPTPSTALLPLAAALVVDEHPSVRNWSRAERAELLDWVAVLIEQHGEEGVQELVRQLASAA